MSRRDFIRNTTVAAAGAAGPEPRESVEREGVPGDVGRPNILVLMTDQQRYDSLGCYGVSFSHTPNLDGLAAEGVVFERCYVNNPICTPSRASLFTGKHLPEHGVYRLYDNLPEDEVLFTERLQEAGYRTALFGKLHVSSVHYESHVRHPHDGFDVYEQCHEGSLNMGTPYQAYSHWLKEKDPAFYERLAREKRGVLHVPRELHMTYWAAERTIDFLRSHRQSSAAPFFCMMSVFEPHNPYEHYPKEMGALVDADAIPEPAPPPREGEAARPAEIERAARESYLGAFDSYSREDLRKMRHGYYASVAYGDLEFGRVLKVLEEEGYAENTLVIFLSDHGDMLGDHGLLVKGAFFYEANVRVPLLMRWPKRFKGRLRVPALVQPHDLAATVLSAAGVDAGKIAQVMPDARNLLELVDGSAEAVHEDVVCCYRNSGNAKGRVYWDPPVHATMILDGRYKLNVWHGTDEGLQGELYDLEQDPGERHNLYEAPEMREVRLRLTGRLLGWLAQRERSLGSRGGDDRPFGKPGGREAPAEQKT